MPGIFGAVAARLDRDPHRVAFAMCDLISHRDWYGRLLRRDRNRVLGAVSANPWFSDASRLAETPDALLLVEGTAFTLDGVPLPDDTPDLARRLLDRYLRDGDACIDAVGGHFNLVVVDKRDGRVQLLNDKLGFAHLYWYADDEVFLFAPELKAFLAWRGLHKRVNTASAGAFLANECPHGTETLLEGVNMLGPAERLVWDGRSARVERRWRAEARPEPDRPLADYVDEALALYERSVAKRLPAAYDGRIVVAVSGGLDSRMLLHQVRGRGNLDLFTHGQEDCVETDIARRTCEVLGLRDRHHLIPMNPEWAGSYARRAVWLNDGQTNLRNATLIGVSEALGDGPVPFLNGILGPYLSIGTGHYVKPADMAPIADEDALRRALLRFTGVERNTAGFSQTMRPEAAALLGEGAREQVWRALDAWRHLPTFAEQKMLHMHANLGRRMQASVDIHKFFFHDLTPFVDEDLFDFWLRIPMERKLENSIYLELYRTRLTGLARVPWSRTGHDLFAAPAAVDRELARRERFRRFSAYVRKASRGRLNPRDRSAYNDRPAWVRRNRVFRDEFNGVLADVGSTGCDWFDQAKVDAIRADLNHGKDWHFHALAQVYTMVVWHGQFLRDAPVAADLVPLEEG
jgi:asparagine synthetase B (glutamine-hydrolysing)